jgi:hypothetical protein
VNYTSNDALNFLLRRQRNEPTRLLRRGKLFYSPKGSANHDFSVGGHCFGNDFLGEAGLSLFRVDGAKGHVPHGGGGDHRGRQSWPHAANGLRHLNDASKRAQNHSRNILHSGCTHCEVVETKHRLIGTHHPSLAGLGSI